jgi:hypothetical protein
MVVERTCDGQRQVKVAITFGLVALVVFAALLVVVGQRVAPRIEEGLGFGVPAQQEYKPGGISYDDERNGAVNSLPVNERAAKEIKKQHGFATNRIYYQGAGRPRVVQPQHDPNCINCRDRNLNDGWPPQPQPSPQPRPQPTPSVQPSNGLTASPTDGKFTVSVFVGTDARSQEFLNWWNTDPNLRTLREQVAFQHYTKDNSLYKTRYINDIPVDSFPAVVFADPRGGHVYASGGAGLPTTKERLYEEIYDAYEAHKTVQHRPNDSNPIQDVEADCPDGNCPTPAKKPFLNPERERLLPILNRAKPNSVESILYWMFYPGEALLVILCAITFLFLLFIVAIKFLRG